MLTNTIFVVTKVLITKFHLFGLFLTDVGKIAHKSDHIKLLDAHFLALVFTDCVLRAIGETGRDVSELVCIEWIRKEVIVVNSLKLGSIRL